MENKNRINIRLLLIFGIMFLVVFILWNTIFIYPVKIFVVFLHELSHGLAAVITGGHIVRIELSPQQGGVCLTSGGWRLLILPAGYLGSMIWGGIILVAASRTNSDKLISIILGILLLVVDLAFIRTIFGFVFCLIMALLMLGLGIFIPRFINDFILKFIGLTSILYAILDIKDDLVVRTVNGSDAAQMSAIIPLPPVVWGIIWIITALIAAVFFLKIASQE